MSRPKKKPSFTKEQLGENPFEIIVEMVKKPMYNQFTVVDGKKEIVVIDLDKADYTKLYTNRINRLTVALLSSKGKELFIWIMFSIKNGEDYIWLNKERYITENETSLTSYRRGIDNLLENYILIETDYRDVYWINPNFFFKGKRDEKYPDNLDYIYED